MPKETSTQQPVGLLAICMDSISSAAHSLWNVGSFIIFFSAALSILDATGLISILSNIISLPLGLLGLPASLTNGILRGTVEMTTGCIAIASTTAPLTTKVLAMTLVITFSGGCILGQSYSVMRQIPVKIGWLLMIKSIQSIFALLICSLILPIFPLTQTTFALSHEFSSILGANATLLIVSTIVLSVLGAGLALYNLRNLPKDS